MRAATILLIIYNIIELHVSGSAGVSCTKIALEKKRVIREISRGQ